MSIFEFIMLICFGIGWPFSILKTLRSKSVAGKSPLFLIIVTIGYASGITHKLLYSRDWVMSLYIINFLMVLTDTVLYFYYASKERLRVNN